MIGLCLTFGTTGWIGLGAFFAVLGLTAPAIARWGERSRPAFLVESGREPEPADGERAAAIVEPALLRLTGSTNYR